LLQLLEHPKTLGLGEIGLDFYYENAPKETQESVFRDQIRLAKQVNKPMIIHTRNAERETLEILSKELDDLGSTAGIMHCFTGSQELAEETIAMGFYIAFGGILTFRKADDLRRIAANVPSERLLIETDCPYLAPEPFRGKRNEPANVARVAEILGKLRGCSSREIGITTCSNFERLFRLAEGWLEVGVDSPECT
jgi:TatD DNase family protein